MSIVPDYSKAHLSPLGAGAGKVAMCIELLAPDPNRDINAFRIALSVPAGSKRGRGRWAFIDSVLDMLDTFYGEVVQHIKPWAAAPPKLREADRVIDVAEELVTTDLSSQDGPEND